MPLPGLQPAARALTPRLRLTPRRRHRLHDLMVNALDLRKPGQGILYRPDGAGGGSTEESGVSLIP